MNKRAAENLRTLAIDVGGSGLKAAILDGRGTMCGERVRVPTPRPATPEAVIGAILALVAPLRPFDRVSVGFPGVVVEDVVRTAPNLDGDWAGVALAAELGRALGVPVHAANDADVQGYGAIKGRGVELVLTLGTGLGASLFMDGRLVPNLELGHHRFRKGETYEEQLGKAARKDIGDPKWNKRLAKAIRRLRKLFNFRRLYIGGGNVKHVTIQIDDDVRLVRNTLGITGGIALWEPRRRPPRLASVTVGDP
ncbi:MAG: chromosome partitioning protein ParA [Chromatiales bacterium 21-64-14]|nr:MAG: chromosome partitioning protein ParA [Chromatiales bacterium 21-64-14]HQU15935.1 ROK family protein [Gammaproteobacteria bacterium]